MLSDSSLTLPLISKLDDSDGSTEAVEARCKLSRGLKTGIRFQNSIYSTASRVRASVPPLSASGESGKFGWLFVKTLLLPRDPMTSVNSRKVEPINQIKIRFHQGRQCFQTKVQRGAVSLNCSAPAKGGSPNYLWLAGYLTRQAPSLLPREGVQKSNR